MGKTALEPTRLQRQFCIEIVKNGGHNATAAYKAAAGPVLGARQSAHKLMHHPKMKEWMTQHRLQLDKKAAYTLESCHADHETAKRMSTTAGEFLTAVDGQMKLHGLTHVTKVVNSIGYTSDALRAMSDDSLIQLLGEGRIQHLACDLSR
jgi:pterin-4a-carbinolamine dehydratase